MDGLGIGVGAGLSTTATSAGDPAAEGRLNPPRTARNPNDVASAARSTNAAPITAGETGWRAVAGGGEPAMSTPRR
jgi:hypothetical protein